MEIHTKVFKQGAVPEEMLIIFNCSTTIATWTYGVKSVPKPVLN